MLTWMVLDWLAAIQDYHARMASLATLLKVKVK